MIKNTELHINSYQDAYFGGYDLRKAGKLGLFFVYNKRTENANAVCFCREIFSGSFISSTEFVGFAARNLNPKLLNEFFQKIDEKLKLKNSVIIHTTKHKSIVIIEVGQFWRATPTMRSLFTLFLRASTYYSDDLFAAFSSYRLSKLIYPVIEHFLAGNSKPIFDTKNIVDYFRPYSPDTYSWNPHRRKLQEDYKTAFVPA